MIIGPYVFEFFLLFFKVDPTSLYQNPIYEYPGNQILQEIWFVALVSILAVLIIVAFVGTVCMQRKKSSMKNLGHYNGKFYTLCSNTYGIVEIHFGSKSGGIIAVFFLIR